MSEKSRKQVRKEVKTTADSLKLELTAQILTFMEQTAKQKSFFGRVKTAFRYIFKKDFRGILGE